MGHDTHFLERLSRVSESHTSLALSLYRDPGLVKEIFRRSEIPEGAEVDAVMDQSLDGDAAQGVVLESVEVRTRTRPSTDGYSRK